ncbi:hypothetical protein B0O80DRAFT_497345 [Mortierella sp. GBAus27b]|nr:hypothetical protein B0O80DRAFT_497345 [Mortierella sp. GBAus27b]
MNGPPGAGVSGAPVPGGHFRGYRLFDALLVIFLAIPTVVLMGWVAWTILVLFLCTMGIVLATAAILGMAMVAYVPVLCICAAAAFACSVTYNFIVWLVRLCICLWRLLFGDDDDPHAPGGSVAGGGDHVPLEPSPAGSVDSGYFSGRG